MDDRTVKYEEHEFCDICGKEGVSDGDCICPTCCEITDGCIASPHWEACETCKNNDSAYGCVIKEDVPLSLHLGDFVICGDYEKETTL